MVWKILRNSDVVVKAPLCLAKSNHSGGCSRRFAAARGLDPASSGLLMAG